VLLVKEPINKDLETSIHGEEAEAEEEAEASGAEEGDKEVEEEEILEEEEEEEADSQDQLKTWTRKSTTGWEETIRKF